jgi:arylsulfatase A
MVSLSRRKFLQPAGAAVVLRGQDAGKSHNIVYILADDPGCGDLRCYNPQSQIPTPNADRLAEGMRFTDMHSGSALCSPTRYGTITGRYCRRTSLKNGVLWGDSPDLSSTGG